ncbi:AMSH-like protease sst2 [Cladobotryum mycophilum]|uniref:AMSH-like protease sst2 n=1 Tax=Cladobotryum mycophilum TaxID=491253 RepID=A0ABR0SU16_9HYPO
MEARSAMRPARPPSVKELVAQAESFTFNVNIDFKYWTRSAETLYQEASFALSDGDYGRAYIMLYRHSVLVLKFLPTHPKLKEPENRKLYKILSKKIDRVLQDLEALKPEIQNAYQEWERKAPPTTASGHKHINASQSYKDFAAKDPSLSGNARILDASEHQDLAVDLAQQEIDRRERDKRTHRQPGSRSERGLSQGLQTWKTNQERIPATNDVDLQKQMEATRRTLDMAHERRYEDTVSQLPTSQHYNYPSLSKSRPVEYEKSQKPISSLPQPARPPKERIASSLEVLEPSRDFSRPIAPPLVPNKVHLIDYQPETSPQSTDTVSQPPLPPKELEAPMPKKERLAFKPGGYLENGDPIRSIFLPSKLKRTFLEIAAKNTAAGLEMCGILCGTPINNALFVRCLLIPDQKSTPDTCETENETKIFDYCMSEDLLMLGWIHTHPTQTCFMSSRDLHTHAGYQVMMPESIAIVCAPKYTPSYGIFRLTHPPGLDHILNCTRSETFHPHSIDNLYREADHPHGHVYESDKMPLQVVDLRNK